MDQEGRVGMTAVGVGDPPQPLIQDDRRNGLFRVHRSAMVSPEVFALERQRIFDRCWLYVGHESELEKRGDFRRRVVGGRPLIFLRDSDGELRVLFNACTHRGATICRQDAGNAKAFQCFYHAWTFDTTGALVTVPDEEAYSSCFDREERRLGSPARFGNYRGFCFVSYNPDVEDLETYLAGAAEYLDLIVDQSESGMRVVPGTNIYSTKANWKLLCENSFDTYHGIPVHQTYFDYINSLGVTMERGRNSSSVDLGNGHAVMQSEAPYGRPIARWHPLFGEDAKEDIEAIRRRLVERHGEERTRVMATTIRNLFVFPNLIVNDIMALTVRYIEPVAPDLMNFSAWALAPVDETAAQLARRLDSYLTFIGPGGFATPDDVEALESCQEGFRTWREVEWSDISRGMERDPTAIDELDSRSFWRAWWRCLNHQSLSVPVGAR